MTKLSIKKLDAQIAVALDTTHKPLIRHVRRFIMRKMKRAFKAGVESEESVFSTMNRWESWFYYEF